MQAVIADHGVLPAGRLAAYEASDREIAVDAACTIAVAFCVCVAAQRLALMSVVVPLAFVVRMLAWSLWTDGRRRRSLLAETALLVACSVLGAFNDWNTVVRHGVYAYTVPTDLTGISTIPGWMLLYWGLILRSVVTLSCWTRLGDSRPRNRVRLPGRAADHAVMKVVLQLALVAGTRQAVYRFGGHPWASWVPFAIALALYFWWFPTTRRERVLAIGFAIAGPAIESAFIHLGGLHRYALGWIGGVPLWIALWWVLAVLLLSDLAPRVLVIARRR